MEMRAAIVVWLAAAMACSAHRSFSQERIHNTFVKDFYSRDPSCSTADVPLNHAQAEAFLKRAPEFGRSRSLI